MDNDMDVNSNFEEELESQEENEMSNDESVDLQGPGKPQNPALNHSALEALFGGKLEADIALLQGLSNLATLPEFDAGAQGPASFYFKPVIEGVMGFRREGGNLMLTVACGTAQAQGIALAKFVAMVERMYDPDRPTIVLQNPSEADGSRFGRGQLLGRLFPESSAIVMGLGLTGRIVSTMKDFAKFDVYYIDRSTLAAYYLAAKIQLSTENTLEELITANEGWYRLGLPKDPFNPFEEVAAKKITIR